MQKKAKVIRVGGFISHVDGQVVSLHGWEFAEPMGKANMVFPTCNPNAAVGGWTLSELQAYRMVYIENAHTKSYSARCASSACGIMSFTFLMAAVICMKPTRLFPSILLGVLACLLSAVALVFSCIYYKHDKEIRRLREEHNL